MPLIREIRRRARQIAPQVLLACLAAYFCYHAFQGERGLLAWQRLKQDLGLAQALNQQLAGQHGSLERSVLRLRPDNLDPDLLEERARLVLNFGHSNDYVLFLPKEATE